MSLYGRSDVLSKSSGHDAVYEVDPHTIVKHKILQKYLQPWFYILSKNNKNVQYIDCFAGSGEYKNTGVIGSPIIALECLNNHILSEDMSSRAFFNFVFIEKDKKRASILEEKIASMNLPKHIQTHVMRTTFEKTMEELYGTEESPKECVLCPTFAFIDPFGYKQIPMTYVRRILETHKCEIMVNFMVDNAKRNAFADKKGDVNFEKGLDLVFGCHDWIGVYDIPEENRGERNEFLANLYVRELIKNLNEGYTLQFKMINKVGHESYRLVFATKNDLGLKLMKEAMWNADERGLYTFDDRLDGQSYLVKYMDEKIWAVDAADILFNEFKGQTKTREEVEKFIILKTKGIYRSEILELLEKKGLITVSNRKTNRGYPDGCRISFKNKQERGLDNFF